MDGNSPLYLEQARFKNGGSITLCVIWSALGALAPITEVHRRTIRHYLDGVLNLLAHRLDATLSDETLSMAVMASTIVRGITPNGERAASATCTYGGRLTVLVKALEGAISLVDVLVDVHEIMTASAEDTESTSQALLHQIGRELTTVQSITGTG